MTLPPPNDSQAFCAVSALEAGILTLDGTFFLDKVWEPGEETTWDVPAFCFLLRHSVRNEYILFDLGVRKDFATASPVGQKYRRMVNIPKDVVERLAGGGITPDEISTVIVSHAHWDHTGDASLFPRSKFILGAQDGIAHDDPNIVFDFPPERTRFVRPGDSASSDLGSTWTPLGPFPHALDLFGDGALYVVDAPGHLPGHINLLARTSSDGGWVYLAGDACHDWRLFTGEAAIAEFPEKTGPERCVHADKKTAEVHLERMRTLEKIDRVRVLLAHDKFWWAETEGVRGFWPQEISSL